MIVDYSTGRPSISALKAAGVTAAGRYIGWDGTPGHASTGKNLTRAEQQALASAGISAFLAFEYAADAPARGAAQGAADGGLAVSQLAALGAPAGMGVYYAADWDVPDYAPSLPDRPGNALAKLGPVGKYFQAIRALKAAHQVGGYGGYWVIKRLFDAGLITLGWQTIAWSGGQRDTRAALYQTGATVLGGADVNVHETAAADFGQWPRPGQPGADPVLASGASGTAVAVMQQRLNVWGASPPLAADGAFGAKTLAAVTAFQHRRGLAADGVCGPLTWAALHKTP